ncbi:hypothetical protein B0H14DRAFT_2863474 [Mycena olivaceomarginata]|nr:hypothetical protein B0H14DRAFT_2863474 [Mycena olivaceomarginata]
MLSHLPQELIELIFDDLDVENLRACALVSSSLVVPSQRLIFRSLVIRLHSDSPPRFFSLGGRGLFRGGISYSTLCAPIGSGIFRSAKQSARIYSPLIPPPRVFEFNGPLILGLLGWDDVTLPLQSAIHNLMTSTNLWSLNLHGIIDVPPSFIVLALSSYTKFGLHNIRVDPSESHVPDRPATLRTEQITLRNVQGIAELILPDTCTRGYLDNIKWLAVGMDPYTHVESRRTLRHLELRCGWFQTSLDLPRLPLLRVLELHIYLRFSAGLPPNLYSTVEALPETVPAIEILRLMFHLLQPDNLANGLVGPLPWFNDATYREKFPCLRRVHCRGLPDRPPQDHIRFSAYMHDKFLGLSGTGVLEVFFGSHEG